MGKILFIYEGDHGTWTAWVHQFELQEKLKINYLLSFLQKGMSGRMPSQFFHMPNTETMEQEETYFQLFSRLVAIPTKTCCISYFSPLRTKKVENTFFGGWSVLPQAWGNNYRRTKTDFFMLSLQVKWNHMLPFFIK